MRKGKDKILIHSNKDLWKLIFSILREIREIKGSVRCDSLEYLLLQIEGIEKELDIILTFLQINEDKKA